jgi:hypothetical protein
MTDLQIFLRVIQKLGYPNENIRTIANACEYNLENFLYDLYEEIGQEGVNSFCRNAIDKLYGPKGIEVNYGHDNYVIIDIILTNTNNFNLRTNDFDAHIEILDSKILVGDEEGNDVYKTIEELNDDDDMDFTGYFDIINHIYLEIYDYVFNRCGFGISFNNRI